MEIFCSHLGTDFEDVVEAAIEAVQPVSDAGAAIAVMFKQSEEIMIRFNLIGS